MKLVKIKLLEGDNWPWPAAIRAPSARLYELIAHNLYIPIIQRYNLQKYVIGRMVRVRFDEIE